MDLLTLYYTVFIVSLFLWNYLYLDFPNGLFLSVTAASYAALLHTIHPRRGLTSLSVLIPVIFGFCQICKNCILDPTACIVFEIAFILVPIGVFLSLHNPDQANNIDILDPAVDPSTVLIQIDAIMANNPANSRVALITGGATVVFKELLEETVSLDFLEVLRAHDFGTVLVQCGTYHETILKKLEDIKEQLGDGITISSFPFSDDLQERMKLCRGEKAQRLGGVVISHAGTGTISDCLEVNCAQIVVANPNLMDNHQQEIADQVAKATHVIAGKLGHLAEAIPEIVKIINEEGLNEPTPAEEMAFPVADKDRLTLIDDVVALWDDEE